jgi:hypothetical protein
MIHTDGRRTVANASPSSQHKPAHCGFPGTVNVRRNAHEIAPGPKSAPPSVRAATAWIGRSPSRPERLRPTKAEPRVIQRANTKRHKRVRGLREKATMFHAAVEVAA